MPHHPAAFRWNGPPTPDRHEQRDTTVTDRPVPPASVSPFGAPHEQVVFCHDEASGLKAIIAIYSTALGPALGGTRFYPYGSEDEALADVLNLSKGMAYKDALAGLDLGGGKAVIIGDPARVKSEALLRAYGRFVQSLGGRYFTACDVGTFSEDMDVIARECDYVTGRTVAHGGAGDSSVLTAFGVFQGMRAAAEHTWGAPRSPVARSASRASERSAPPGRAPDQRRCRGRHHRRHAGRHRPRARRAPRGRVWPTGAALVGADVDVYAPCALGGALDDDVEVLKAKIVCGGANNQLAHAGIEKQLADRGITTRPTTSSTPAD